MAGYREFSEERRKRWTPEQKTVSEVASIAFEEERAMLTAIARDSRAEHGGGRQLGS